MHMFINESLDVFANKNISVKKRQIVFCTLKEISLYKEANALVRELRLKIV